MPRRGPAHAHELRNSGLTDAQISSIHYASTEGSEELEFVSLSYHSMRIESPGGASATADWVT
jgi:type VI protein secretion system component Hcp